MKLPFTGYWNLFSRHMLAQKGRFALLVTLLVGGTGLQVAAPQIMRSFMDAAAAGKPLAALTLAAAAFIGTALVQQAVGVARSYLGQSLAWKATNELRADLAGHALSLDMGFHNDHSPGELIERIDGDMAELSSFFSQFVLGLASNGLLLLGIIVALFLEDWRAGLAFACFAAGSLALMSRFKSIAVPHQKARRQAEAALYGFVEEQLNGTEDLRANGAVGWSIRELYLRQAEVLVHSRRAALRSWLLNNATEFCMVAGMLMSFGFGYWLHAAGLATLGTAYMFVHYLNLLEEPLWEMTRQLQSFQTVGACVERLTEFLALRPEVTDPMGDDRQGDDRECVGRPEPTKAGEGHELAFSDVHFGYDGRNAVLKGISFGLRRGRILGLLGRTGSGKTTLARLVFRLYDPQRGSITLGGRDLRDSRLTDIRKRVALVTQDVQLFKATVRDNITFFDESISDERIMRAIRELELDSWLESLPGGLDTMLDSGGQGMSAGEAQLLALTRVFLRDPSLVVLDEASSRLDPATERRLERALDRLLAGRTSMVIAHRLGTLDRAHDIMILEDGGIAEYGERAALASDGSSRFSGLLRAGLEEVLA